MRMVFSPAPSLANCLEKEKPSMKFEGCWSIEETSVDFRFWIRVWFPERLVQDFPGRGHNGQENTTDEDCWVDPTAEQTDSSQRLVVGFAVECFGRDDHADNSKDRSDYPKEDRWDSYVPVHVQLAFSTRASGWFRTSTRAISSSMIPTMLRMLLQRKSSMP